MSVRLTGIYLLGALLVLSCATSASAKKKPNMPPGWQWPASDAMKAKGETCLDSLSALGVPWKRAKAKRFITTPITVPDMDFAGLRLVPTFRKGPFVMDCHLALAIATVAPQLVQMDVSALRFSSIHAIRKVRVGGKRKKSLSRHSLGLAIDVYEIAPSKGDVLVVKKHYWKRPMASEVEALVSASSAFRMVLSPANDPKSHYDHLHLEASVGDDKRVRKRGTNRQARKRRARARKQRVRKRRSRARAKRHAQKKRARIRKKRRTSVGISNN